MIHVKKAAQTDIPVIRELARVTWAIAYAAILSPQQMDYMLTLFYSSSSLAEQMKKGHSFILAMDGGSAVGFASYSPKDDTGREQGVYRLHKIYIDPNQQGKGIGQILLGHIIADIRPAGATDLELNVNRHNKALGFYKTFGFTILREEDIDIGEGYFMNDYIMNLNLEGLG
jgi:ribosomal protein S18 acetylase RimI-like enzyme